MSQMEERTTDNECTYLIIFTVDDDLSLENLVLWKTISKEVFVTEEDIFKLINSVLDRYDVLNISFARIINDKIEHPCTISCINKKPSEDQLLEFARDVFVLIH